MIKYLKQAALIFIIGLFLFTASGCETAENGMEQGDVPAPNDDESRGEIVVSGKTFTEALTLGYLTAFLLEDRGFDVIDEVGLAEVALIRPALESGQIDIYWEYTGTGLMNIMGHDEVVTDPRECYELIRDWDLENNNLVWLDYAPANNTFVIFTSPELAEEHGWTKISEIASYISAGNSLKLATAAEWTERADGLPNFEAHYEFEFPRSDLVIVELGLAYQAVATGQADIGNGDATEGRIAQYNLLVLEDDKMFFPAYNPAPVVRGEILEAYPEIADIMKELSVLLDLETLTDLNKEVAVDGEQPEAVAMKFLIENELIE